MLDIECFTYLHRALESPISPIVVSIYPQYIFSIFESYSKFQGFCYKPRSLSSSRHIIVRWRQGWHHCSAWTSSRSSRPSYDHQNCHVQRFRIERNYQAQSEGWRCWYHTRCDGQSCSGKMKISLKRFWTNYLLQIGSKTSLRYSCQLLTPSKIIASANAKEQVNILLSDPFCEWSNPGWCWWRGRSIRAVHGFEEIRQSLCHDGQRPQVYSLITRCLHSPLAAK